MSYTFISLHLYFNEGKIIKKRILKIGVYILTGIITIIVLISFLLHSSISQTLLARIATSYYSNKFNTTISIDKISISFFNKIQLRNLLINDLHGDTLICSGEVDISLKRFNLKKRVIHFGKIDMENADIRIRKYKDENYSNYQFLLGEYANRNDTIVQTTSSPGWDIRSGKVEIVDSRFIFDNQNKPGKHNQIDYAHIDVSGLNVDVSDAFIVNDSVSANVENISLNEKSGFTLDSLSGDIKIGSFGIIANKLKVNTPRNKIDIDLRFSVDSFADFADFVNKVKIDADFRPSIINLSEVGYFAPVMYSMDNRMKVVGKIKGYVNNFRAKQFKFAVGNNTQFRGDIQMNGLPNIDETFSHLSITSLITTADDISNFKLPTEDVNIKIPAFLEKLGDVNVTGKFTGFFNDFVSDAEFKTGIGDVATNLALVNNDNKNLSYVGFLKMDNFNVGMLFGVENLGKVDGSADIIGEGATDDILKVNLKGAIDSLEFNDYVYQSIDVKGDIANNQFNGNVIVNDKNLKLVFNGTIDDSKAIPIFNFNALVKDAKLYRLNFSDRDSSMNLSSNLNFNFQGDKIDQMQGLIKIDSTRYFEKGERYKMDDFTLSFTRDSSEYSIIRLFSDIADASVEGKFLFADLPVSVNNLFNNYLDTLFVDSGSRADSLAAQDFVFDLTVKNSSPITKLFVPDLEIAPYTTLIGGYNSVTGNLFVEGHSPEITIYDKKMENWNLDFFFKDEYINLSTGCDRFYLSDSLFMDSLVFNSHAQNDSLLYSLTWNNRDGYHTGFGDISGVMKFNSSKEYSVNFKKSELMISDTLWHIYPDNSIEIDSNYLVFNNFSFTSGSQGLYVNGVVSENPTDSLSVKFDNFNLSTIEYVLKNRGIHISGIVNGGFQVSNIYNSANFLSDIDISNMYFEEEKLGDFSLKTTWDQLNETFNILGQLIYRGSIGEKKTFEIIGKYLPGNKNQNFDIDIYLDNFKLKTFEPFTKSFSSKIGGLGKGHLKLRGTKEAPELTGELDLMRVSLLIDYLNVTYYFAEKVSFDKDKIYFNDLVLNDSLNNKGTGYGAIYHDHLSNIRLDLHFNVNKMAVLNTGIADNDIFYGKGFATGKVEISGPTENINLDIDAATEKGTMIYLPLNTVSEVADNNFVTFISDESDTIIIQKIEEFNTGVEGLSMYLKLKLNYDANLQMFLPAQLGNLRGRGNGIIEMDLKPPGKFTMAGKYIIERGSFFLTLQNIINRDFEIMRGSAIDWDGDPYEAKVNISAAYKVKTQLGEYGPPQDSATRVDVDCIIHMNGKLLNPDISFSIDFPYIKETDKSYIYSRLDTTDQAMMSQQVLSLLVMNSFYYSSGYSGSLNFNSISLLTNQLNNILSKISDDFDIGVNYKPGDNNFAQEVGVAMSTQLFDNRVSVSGNVGVRGKDDTRNTNDIVGEVDVEVKLTDDGRWRAFAFNRSNNNLLYQNYSLYTQGVGLSYTKEFYKFSDLFKRRTKEERELRKKERKLGKQISDK